MYMENLFPPKQYLINSYFNVCVNISCIVVIGIVKA